MGNGDAKNGSEAYCAVVRIPALVLSLPRKVHAVLVFLFCPTFSVGHVTALLPAVIAHRIGSYWIGKAGGALMMLVLARRGM